MSETLTQEQLAERWHVSTRTLARWRDRGEGPAWAKIGARVLYRVADVERYEREHTREGQS